MGGAEGGWERVWVVCVVLQQSLVSAVMWRLKQEGLTVGTVRGLVNSNGYTWPVTGSVITGCTWLAVAVGLL